MYRAFEALLDGALGAAVASGALSLLERPACRLEPAADPVYGDATCRVAMVVARRLGRPAIDVARVLVDHVDDRRGWVERLEAAGPGFVNVTASLAFWREALAGSVDATPLGTARAGRAYVVAAVPADRPAGPRARLLAGTLGRLLAAAGWEVERGEHPIDALAARTDAAALGRVIVFHDPDEPRAARRAKDALAAAGGAAGRVVGVPVGPLVLRRRGQALGASEWPAILGQPAARFVIAGTPAAAPAIVDVERLASDRIDNPWVGVHYALVRIGRVTVAGPAGDGCERLGEAERACLQAVGTYPDVVALAARRVEPDAVVGHARHLAAAFHRYYNRGRFLDGEPGMVQARLTFAQGVARVLAAALDVVGAAGAEQG